MGGKFLGYVAGDDPLHGFLSRLVHDGLGVREPHPAFRVFRLSGSTEVYAYEEKSSRARVIGKFYGPKYGWDRNRAESIAHQEFQSLETLRSYDLVGSPHHVIRPLGYARDLNCVLVLEYYAGEQFSQAIGRSIQQRDDAHLFWRLKALAYFLATQHNRTANGATVDFDTDRHYFSSLVRKLLRRRRIGQWDAEEFLWLDGLWRDRPQMWQDRQVLLHGDATPANFLFGRGLDVAAIDLERMKRGDRMFDVGRVAGELQHAFMLSTGSRHRAEPFIGHFLWEYSCHFPDRQRTFDSLSSRLPYFMGLNLMRIARNDYISADYGDRLVGQAKRLLRAA
jgi:hypothetical protein